MAQVCPEKIHYLGLFSSPVSWAKVNREFVLALDRIGINISATPERGLHYEKHFELDPRLEKIFNRPRTADIELAMEYPENLSKLQGNINMSWILYETNLPESWVQSLKKHCDLFLCPGEFVRDKAIEAGFSEDTLLHVPFGVNMERYHPGVSPLSYRDDDFIILFVGPQHKRKGIRELLHAYMSGFDQSDDVTLFIKTYPPASKNQKFPWEVDVKEYISNHSTRNNPRIKISTQSLSEANMASLFKRADLLVLPSYGEAFGLSVLEAMAVGTPVIGTDNPALSELITKENGWLVPGETRDLTEVAYDCDRPREFVVPRKKALQERLRTIFEDPSRIETRKSAAIRTAKHYPWKKAAQTFREKLRARYS